MNIDRLIGSIFIAGAVLLPAQPAQAAVGWAAATTNRTFTESGYTRLNSPWGHWHTANLVLTDIGNRFDVGEDCHASITVVRADGSTARRARLETWPRGGAFHAARSVGFRLGGGRVQVRTSVWGTLHYASMEGHFAPVRYACKINASSAT